MIPADATIFDWMEGVAAIATALTVAFLVWDRFVPKRLKVSGYVDLALAPIHDGVVCRIYLFAPDDERLLVAEVGGWPFFELAQPSNMTLGLQRRNGWKPRWERLLQVQAVAQRGHDGNTPVLTVLLRDRPSTPWTDTLAWWLEATVTVRGVAPYRGKGFIANLTVAREDRPLTVRRR